MSAYPYPASQTPFQLPEHKNFLPGYVYLSKTPLTAVPPPNGGAKPPGSDDGHHFLCHYKNIAHGVSAYLEKLNQILLELNQNWAAWTGDQQSFETTSSGKEKGGKDLLTDFSSFAYKLTNRLSPSAISLLTWPLVPVNPPTTNPPTSPPRELLYSPSQPFKSVPGHDLYGQVVFFADIIQATVPGDPPTKYTASWGFITDFSFVLTNYNSSSTQAGAAGNMGGDQSSSSSSYYSTTSIIPTED